MRSEKPEDREVGLEARRGLAEPEEPRDARERLGRRGPQDRAPPRGGARFLEYLASDEAQAHFADGNDEWPAVRTAKVKNPALDALGPFQADRLDVAALSRNTAAAQKIYDRAGWR